MDGFNIDPSVLQNVVNAASLSLAPVNAIDPDLDVASQWRTSLSVNYDADLGFLGDGWLFGADILYSDIIDAYQWTDLRSVVIGTLPDGRPRYDVRARRNPDQRQPGPVDDQQPRRSEHRRCRPLLEAL